ncbi:MAG: carboxypeptidase-like regulatory domain-containing protein [Mycoplasmatota bacterium]
MYGKDKYKLNFSNEFDLNNLEEFYQTIELDEADLDYEGQISGTIVTEDGDPIENSTVKIFDLEFNPIKHTMTNENGEFLIQNIEKGEYLVYAVKDGFLMSTRQNVNVDSAEVRVGNIQLAFNTTYQNANIFGITYDDIEGFTLANVRISLRTGSANGTILTETMSATDGEYLFMDIPAGTYYLTATADDYTLGEAVQVIVSENTHVQQQLYLSRLNTKKEGTINGVIVDRLTKKPISNCFVGLYTRNTEDGKEVLINTTRSDSDGRYFFGTVPEGRYVVKAKCKNN